MKTRSRTPGICRIDQPAKHNHGYFVRLQRRCKIHSAFFTDITHGGRKPALAAAQRHHRKLLAKLGPPKRRLDLWWAEIRRRKGSSRIVGVQKLEVWRGSVLLKYWVAVWSPEPYVVLRKVFSIQKYGARKARRLAIRARRAGVRSMLERVGGKMVKRILHLTQHREWFAAVAARKLHTEYRDHTPYWRRQLEGRKYDFVQFRIGYATTAPEMLVEFRGLRRYGKGRNAYYAIRLGRILKIKRWPRKRPSASRGRPA